MTGCVRARRLGLRARVTISFAAGALLLSALLALLTYLLSRNYLLHQRESSARRQAYVNARLVEAGLRTTDVDVPALLASLETPADSQSLVYRGARWFSTSVSLPPDDLPTSIRQKATNGVPAQQLFRLTGRPQFAVGLPIGSVDSTYFEVFSLAELNGTLHFLTVSLLAAAAVTTLAGAGLGHWASGRVLRPVHAVAATAAVIAAGRLDSRLPVDGDRELDELAASFNAMVDALQRRMERDARFASDVSHELRSPLTTLATSVSVLQRRSRRWGAGSQEAVDLIADEVRRFERLVSDLLEIARVDAGQADTMLEQVQLGELILQAVKRSKYADTPVVLEAAATSCPVLADKRRFERILTNLLDNAQQHGGGAVQVTVTRSDGLARVAVDDAGPGVPPGDREAIFARFARTTAANRESNGAGLGLALVADHVRAHHGRVWVQDRPGRGARFVVELPVAET